MFAFANALTTEQKSLSNDWIKNKTRALINLVLRFNNIKYFVKSLNVM